MPGPPGVSTFGVGLTDTEAAGVTVAVGDVRLPTERLEAEIVAYASRIAAAKSRWLQLIAEYDRRQGWASWGMTSCAAWLSWSCGLDIRSAREHVRVARRLGGLPELAAVMNTGRLSFSKVRAITRVVEHPDDPALDGLLTIATHGTAAHLESVVRGLRTCDRITTTETQARADRVAEAAELAELAAQLAEGGDGGGDGGGDVPGPNPRGPEPGWVTARWGEFGDLDLRGLFTTESGAVVLAALDAARADLRTPDQRTPDQRPEDLTGPGGRVTPTMADALMAMAENYLANRHTGSVRTLASHERAAIVVHLDATLASTALNGSEVATEQPAATDGSAEPPPTGHPFRGTSRISNTGRRGQRSPGARFRGTAGHPRHRRPPIHAGRFRGTAPIIPTFRGTFRVSTAGPTRRRFRGTGSPGGGEKCPGR